MIHKKRCDIDWALEAEEIRIKAMKSIGMRALANPIRFAPRVGAEWETDCDKCGMKIIYCTEDQEPDLSIKTCSYCKEE